MQLNINQFNATDVTLIHGDETIKWSVSLFDKINTGEKLEDRYDIFEHINQYWNYISPATQNNIFSCYKRIRDAFNNVWDTTELTKQLYVLIAELTSYHDLEQIKQWVNFHSNIIMPDNLRTVYTDSYETPGTSERTYLRKDYEDLVALSVGLRVMIPIWGEFISRTKKETGTKLKEYYAFKLLAYSNYTTSEPMERLRVYVQHSLPQEKMIAAAIITAVSSDDFPKWILALVVVRRLSVADIRGILPNSSIVSSIYKFITGKVRGHDSDFLGRITDKETEGQSSDGENNLSKLEGYKIKQEIPAGDIAIIEYYLKDSQNLAKMICPSIDPNLVEACLNGIENNRSYQIHQTQTTIMQWVLRKAIPPRGIMYINKNLCLLGMAVTEALLWHNGFHDMAVLSTAIEHDNSDDSVSASSDSRARITKEQVEVLETLYPYSRKPTGKQRVVKNVNPAVESIDLLCGQFKQCNWRVMVPEQLLETVPNFNRGLYVIPYDIKIKTAALVISLANRNFYGNHPSSQKR